MLTVGSLAAEAGANPLVGAAGGLGSAPASSSSGAARAAAALSDDISMISVPLDIASYGAIMGSIVGVGGNAASPAAAADFRAVTTMIGNTLQQGQGGYYLAINAPGASLQTAMTPSQLGAYMQSGGTLDPDSVTASDGHTYSLYGLLKQAFTANAKAVQEQALNLTDPRTTMAEKLLGQMWGDSALAGSQRARLFGSNSPGAEADKTVRTLVLQMAGTPRDGVRLSIVYFPPGGSAATAAASGSGDAPTTLRLTA